MGGTLVMDGEQTVVSLVIDGERTAVASDDVTLNPNDELEGPAKGDWDTKVEGENADHYVSEIESNVGNETAVGEGLDENADCGVSEIESNVGNETADKEGLNESADHDVSEIEPNVGNETTLEEGFDENADRNVCEIESNMGNVTAVEEHLDGNADRYVSVIEPNVGNETAGEEGLDKSADRSVSEIESNRGNETSVEECLDGNADRSVSEIEPNVVNETAIEEGLDENADRDFSGIEPNVGNETAVEEGLDENADHNVFEIESNVGNETVVEEGLDENADRNVSEIESNVGNETAVEEGLDDNADRDVSDIEPNVQNETAVEEGLDENADRDVFEIKSNVGNETAVEEHVANFELVGLQEGQEMETEEQDTNSEEPNVSEDISAEQATLNPGSAVKAHQASYQLPLDDEGEFNVSDLVWGKVKSHPWWPGQIFDPSDASEKAMKYQKKDCFLVAYFGDRTFAWNEASVLKPFRSYFSQAVKQSNSETFQNAVDCALEEFSRRVELGLTCSCIPEEIYDEIKFQIVENTGIQQESSVRDRADKSLQADLFEPGKLVEYVKALAQSPAGGADKLELAIAQSQLVALYHLKGYPELPDIQLCGGLLENADTLRYEDESIGQTTPVYEDYSQISSGQETFPTQRSSYHKRKHNLKHTIYPRRKEKSMSVLMGDSWDSVDDEIDYDRKANSKFVSSSPRKKRKGSHSFDDDSSMLEGRKTISLAKVSITASSLAKPSFKIGECIQRVASQMTGSHSILKANNQKQDVSNDGFVGDEFDAFLEHSEEVEMRKAIVPTEHSSLDELLSQLHLAAQDPLRGYSFLTIIVSFFSDFRNSVIMEQYNKVGGKRKYSTGGFPETFEFEEMSDTYWRDRVIQNGSGEQPRRQSRKLDNHLVPANMDKPVSKSNSRKRYSDGNYDKSTEKPSDYVDENALAELIMHFPVVDSVPSETSLNKMFRRFGPLKESETEIDKFTNRARVVFKKCSDAEAAYGSAPKFNIFGSVLVNYQLNYTISVPFKTEPAAILHDEDATLFLQY